MKLGFDRRRLQFIFEDDGEIIWTDVRLNPEIIADLPSHFKLDLESEITKAVTIELFRWLVNHDRADLSFTCMDIIQIVRSYT